jgi:hypothetical protein
VSLAVLPQNKVSWEPGSDSSTTMIVSHARQFIFFHNPKCAGTSMRAALAPYHDDPFSFWGIFPAPFFRNHIDHSHLRLWEMQVLFPHIIRAAQTYRSVIFVRNPYRRFLSAIDEHFKKFQPSAQLEKMSRADQIKTIEAFIERVLNVGLITTNFRFIHFSPQLWFIRLGDRTIPGCILPMDDRDAFITRAFEYLELEPRSVRRENPSRLELVHTLASSKVTAFVRDFYALDFEFFAADPKLQHLVDIPLGQRSTPASPATLIPD